MFSDMYAVPALVVDARKLTDLDFSGEISDLSPSLQYFIYA